jgi:hypothetical protein
MLCTIGLLLLLLSSAGWVYVRFRLKPKDDSELDDYHWEFEEQHPQYARYLKWSKITFAGLCLSVLLLFIAAII